MIHYEYIGERGKALAEKISGALPPYDRDGVVFIGALGICVRKLQTLIRDKYTDPAVVCVDTTGRWVIPVLSGHVGGANDLARRIAQITGGQAVVTTQSDNAGLWPLDTLAQEFGWGMVPVERAVMNANIAKFVSGRPTALLLEWDDRDTRQLLHTCPEHVTVFRSYDDYRQSQTDFELTIAVSYRLRTEADIQYIPRCLRLGFGCQKQLPLAAAGELLAKLEEQGISPEAVNSINTIELKRDGQVFSPVLEMLHQLHIHPHGFSKYCMGSALTCNGIGVVTAIDRSLLLFHDKPLPVGHGRSLSHASATGNSGHLLAGIGQLQCAINCLQQTVSGISSTYVPAGKVTPLPAPNPFPPVPPYGPYPPYWPFVPPVPPAVQGGTNTGTTTPTTGN